MIRWGRQVWGPAHTCLSHSAIVTLCFYSIKSPIITKLIRIMYMCQQIKITWNDKRSLFFVVWSLACVSSANIEAYGFLAWTATMRLWHLLLSNFKYIQWSVMTSTCDAARLCLTRLQININHSQQLIPDEEIQTNSMCHCHAIKATVVAQVTQWWMENNKWKHFI